MATLSETIKSINPKAKFTYINEDINTDLEIEFSLLITFFVFPPEQQPLDLLSQVTTFFPVF